MATRSVEIVSVPKLLRLLLQGLIILLIVTKVSSAANVTYMSDAILTFFSNIRHHNLGEEYKFNASEFVYNEFQKFGLEVYRQPFWTGMLSATNVIGVLKGVNNGTANDKIIGLGAHYDTVQRSPGVNDNGSGMAAMLNVAKEVSSRKDRNYTVIFVAFDLKEKNREGSKHFLAAWYNQYLRWTYKSAQPKQLGFTILDSLLDYNTSANSQIFPDEVKEWFRNDYPEVFSSLESNKWTGDFILNAFRDKVDERALAKCFADSWKTATGDKYRLESVRLEVPDVPVFEDLYDRPLGHFLKSDHARFWEQDMPAIFLTDTGKFRGYMQQCHHEMCDNVHMMLTDDNLKFLAHTVDSLVLAINKLSGLPDGDENGQTAASVGSGNNTDKLQSNSLMTFLCFVIMYMF